MSASKQLRRLEAWNERKGELGGSCGDVGRVFRNGRNLVHGICGALDGRRRENERAIAGSQRWITDALHRYLRLQLYIGERACTVDRGNRKSDGAAWHTRWLPRVGRFHCDNDHDGLPV